MLLLVLMQVSFVGFYVRWLRKSKNNSPNSDFNFCPRTAVILCVRGEDPTLLECLTGLALQSYSNYELHVVSDAADDPALEMVNSFFGQNDYPKLKKNIHVMSDHAHHRSLKCSALIYAIQQLDPSVEVIAIVDADVAADPEWLRDLIAPLENSGVGASTGNRWFSPSDSSIGSLVKQVWNAGALPQMAAYNIAWGGTLAIKVSAIQKCNLLNHWSKAFCEDTMLASRLQANDLQLVRPPNLIVSNRENSNWNQSLSWITRQLLTIRLHHPNWIFVFLHGLSTGFCLVVPIALVIFLTWTENYFLAVIMAAAYIFFQLINLGLFEWIRNGNLSVLAGRKSVENQPSLGPIKPAFRLLATQFTYALAVCRASCARTVGWRGIQYRIKNGKVEMQQYIPFRETIEKQSSDPEASID
ncbi:MAG: glycosyltransferase family 2 protein [Planctomycetota bacterium]